VVVRLLVLVLLFIPITHAKTSIIWKNCRGNECLNYPMKYGESSEKISAIYESKVFKKPICFLTRNCWLFLGEVAGSVDIELNGKELTSFSDSNSNPIYIHHRSLFVPIPNAFLNSREYLISSLDSPPYKWLSLT
jgi:hypothetical protein